MTAEESDELFARLDENLTVLTAALAEANRYLAASGHLEPGQVSRPALLET